MQGQTRSQSAAGQGRAGHGRVLACHTWYYLRGAAVFYWKLLSPTDDTVWWTCRTLSSSKRIPTTSLQLGRRDSVILVIYHELKMFNEDCFGSAIRSKHHSTSSQFPQIYWYSCTHLTAVPFPPRGSTNHPDAEMPTQKIKRYLVWTR